MNGATTSSLLVSRFNGSLVGDVFMIAGSKKQRIPVGFWRLVRSVRVIGRRSNYLCLWGLSNFAKLISLETFGCIKQPFFRNLLTLLNLHKLSSAAILSTAGNFLLNSAFHLHADPEPASRTTYAVLMSSKKSETAVYGWNPALLKFYQSVVLMSCKVKSFYVVRSALLLCLSLQIFAGTLPEVFTIYTRRPSFLFNRVYVAVIWVVTKERCVITQMHRRRHWSDFPKTRNCGTGARAIF